MHGTTLYVLRFHSTLLDDFLLLPDAQVNGKRKKDILTGV